ncbi:MAG TPA: SAM-dependent methyltransferase [Planctomycetes bacterium]|nr:SAM-dependent methyltransferase [Planctomycetaceae bacterium]HIN95356.1 SAM-dependent methyltransferase [Planctomycetota bacterium]
MFDASQYQLLDFGQGRKLERFGPLILDRVSPAAESDLPSDPEKWQQSHVSYHRREAGKGTWIANQRLLSELGSLQNDGLPAPWKIQHKQLQMELRLTPAGHVGLFPEQATNWDWLTDQIRQTKRPLKVLNLFAYTGGSTLAAASAGAEVVHVDAARNIIAWARRNARHGGFQEAPIRWICEDCFKFVQRELERGNEYDAVILDPPSYGHGPDGQSWQIQQHLPPLLDACAELTRQHRQFMLLTCHSPAYGPAELHALLADHVLGSCQQGGDARLLTVDCVDGRRLPSGVVARWPG